MGILRTQIQPEKVPERGGTRDITFIVDIRRAQLQVIEERRTGPVTLAFDFSGYWLVDGAPDAFWSAQFEHEVKQGEWVVLLGEMQYRRVLLVELDAPKAGRSPTDAAAVEYFDDAQRHYLAQDWRLTVESLRQSLAALVGKQPDEEDDETDVQGLSRRHARRPTRDESDIRNGTR